MTSLENDLALFRRAFNQRVLYFRQLQEISDSVAEIELDATIDIMLQRYAAEEVELDQKINTNRARQRYLAHLTKAREKGELQEDDECCILCRCEFVRGFITQWYV
jgi:E3 ubiquitin-protein ligase SHPRH